MAGDRASYSGCAIASEETLNVETSKRDIALFVATGIMGILWAMWADSRRVAEENAYVCAIDSDHTVEGIRGCFKMWGVRVPKGY